MTEIKRFNGATFFKACESLKEEKQWFLDNQPNLKEAGRHIQQIAGLDFIPSEKAVRQMQEATGVKWNVKMKTGRVNRFSQLEDLVLKQADTIQTLQTELRVVAKAVQTLYGHTGKTVPLSMANLLNKFAKPEETNSVPVPVVSK